MCFSATASFVAGGALSAVGVAALKEVRHKREIALASIPLLFGVQQIMEGFVWFSLSPGMLVSNTVPIYLYYFFAHVFWPVYVPFAILSIETNVFRRRIIALLQTVGLIVGGYYAYYMLTSLISARIVERSIVYSFPWDAYSAYVIAGYVIVTCGSCLASSNYIIRVFGILALAFLAMAVVFYYAAFVSVWCFFAAILSVAIYIYFKRGARGTLRVR